MLFTSYEFVLVFLPITLVLVLGGSAIGFRGAAKVILFGASLVFYAWWNPAYVLLLLALLAFNFLVGSWLIRTSGQEPLARRRFAVVMFGLGVNIGAFIYFKYTNFLLRTIEDLTGAQFSIAAIVLPLGISFIVFQKIAFLVDAYAGQIKRLGFLDYALFVTFFPQLISGPIVHHREVIPQFEAETSLRYARRVVPIAIAFLVIGAFKKVIIADQLSSHVADVFTAASGSPVGLSAAWIGSLTFTIQIYFDFSGYSDIAIGLGLLFGIRLPFNFNSPLKATSMIDFWSRWHMTLTRFLTAYIYNPIALRATRARIGQGKRVATRGVMSTGSFLKLLAVPTLFTMFIAGLWHGAGFQFIVFGLIHGGYLVVNHGWRNFRRAAVKPPELNAQYGIWIGRAITFIALVISIPFFRADSVHTAWSLVESMFGGHGLGLNAVLRDLGFVAALVLVLVAAQVLPNSQEVMRTELEAATAPLARHAGEGRTVDPARSWSWPRLSWKPSVIWAVALGVTAWYVVLKLAAPTEFLYFQF